MKELQFFDCSCRIGTKNEPLPDAVELLEEMDHYGIDRALVHHNAYSFAAEATNRDLAQMLEADTEKRLTGVWTLLPDCCGELGGIEQFFAAMAKHRIKALKRGGGEVEKHAAGIDLYEQISHVVIAVVQIDGTHEQQIPIVHIKPTERLTPGEVFGAGGNLHNPRILTEDDPAAADHFKINVQNIDGVDQPGGVFCGIEHFRQPCFLRIGHAAVIIGLHAPAEGLVIQEIQVQRHHLVHPGVEL